MDALAIVLLIAGIISFVVGAVLLIVLIIKAVRKDPLKRIGIATGSVFGIFALSIIGIIILVSVRAGMETIEQTTASNTNNPTPVESQQSNLDEEDENTIDFSTYEEADRDKVNANEYENDSDLKLTDTLVVAIVPSDDHPGNDIAVQIDGGDGLILNDPVGRSGLEENESYTFYGTPNGEKGLIIIGVE